MHTRYSLLPTLALFTGFFFFFALLGPTSALAQRTAETVDTAPERVKRTPKTSEPISKSSHTPATTIENSSGDLILQSSEGGSFLAPGLGGAIPAEGPGVRMMWYPARKAFRAGEVGTSKDGTQWDADSTGEYSVAFGDDTKASGDWSMAVGDETEATGLSATATGWETQATGDQSTTMGRFTTASADESVAMGTISKARGENSLAVGFDALANDNHQLVAGRCNDLSSGYLFVVGNGPLNSAGDACDSFSDALTLDTGGNMTIAGSLTENSDRRLKTDIQPLDDGVLGALQEIDPVRFRFEDGRTHPSGKQLGLIAQEVQTEFPELVSEGEDGMLSLSYTKFSAVLLKGLQEQQSQISDLKAENEEIKERLAALESEQTAPAAASLFSPWGLALGLGGLAGGILWRRRS